MIEKLHSPLGNTEKKVNEIIDWVIALCNMHDFDRHLHLSALQSYAPVAPALDTKQEKCPELTGHGKIVCKKCGDVIAQCRCIEGHNNIEYSVCQKCSSGTMGDK